MFGVFLPQLRMSFATIEAKVRSAEELGYHSVWLMDHLAAPAAPEHDTLEGWTLAAALAARTSKIRLGHLVTADYWGVAVDPIASPGGFHDIWFGGMVRTTRFRFGQTGGERPFVRMRSVSAAFSGTPPR